MNIIQILPCVSYTHPVKTAFYASKSTNSWKLIPGCMGVKRNFHHAAHSQWKPMWEVSTGLFAYVPVFGSFLPCQDTMVILKEFYVGQFTHNKTHTVVTQKHDEKVRWVLFFIYIHRHACKKSSFCCGSVTLILGVNLELFHNVLPVE